MKKIMALIITVAMVCLLAGTVFAEDAAAYTGRWYMCMYENSECIKTQEMTFNEDSTITFVGDPGTTGTWAIQGTELTVRTAASGSEFQVIFKFDVQSQAFWATVGSLDYGIMRIEPEKVQEMVFNKGALLRDFEGTWKTNRIFNSEGELPLDQYIAENMKLNILEATLRDVSTGEKAKETVPYVSMYEDVEENPITEYVKAEFSNGTIYYKVLETGSTNYDIKYSGEINLREDGDLLMTVVYAGETEPVMVIWTREPAAEDIND